MDSTPREKLRELVERYGPEIGQDARRCEALLRDVCGSFRKEIFALTAAVKEGIPEGIRTAPDDVPLKMLLAKYASQLHVDLGLGEEICQWTIESWAFAVGRATKRELRPETRCPECETYIQIPARLNGKPAKCPRCETRLLVSADGSQVERRPEVTTAQLAAEKKNEGGTQLGIVAAETAEEMFGQIVARMIANRGQLSPVDLAQLEQAWMSLGLHPPTAMRIVENQRATVRAVPRNFPQGINRHRAAPVMSSGAWHVRTIDGGHFGPLDDEMICHWHSQGQIAPTALIWREGWTEWYPSAQVTIPKSAVRTQSTHSPQAKTSVRPPPPTHAPTTTAAQSPFRQHPARQPTSTGPASARPPVPPGTLERMQGITSLAVASIVLGFVLPPLGFLLGVLALAQGGGLRAKLLSFDASSDIKRKVDAGTNCAIAGLIIAVFVAAAWGFTALILIEGL